MFSVDKNNVGKIPLFAKNLEGYKNLIKLSSKSFLEIKENEAPHCTIEDIENNILTGFTNYDLGLPGTGILIWHIKEPLESKYSVGINNNRDNRFV